LEFEFFYFFWALPQGSGFPFQVLGSALRHKTCGLSSAIPNVCWFAGSWFKPKSHFVSDILLSKEI